MRGKDDGVAGITQSMGITPAYAGKSLVKIVRIWSCRDHPRLCGEKTSRTKALIRKTGSPPPMRGKDDMIEINEAYSRITPAYAGKRQMPAPQL